MTVWFVLAQVMGVITICFDFITYQIKDHRKYLLVYAVGSVFWTLMFVFLGLDTGLTDMLPMIIAAAFGILRSIVFWWIFAKQTKRRKIAGRVFLYVALAIGLVAAITSISRVDAQIRWIPIVGLFAALSFIIGQYLPSKHYLRGFAFAYAIAVILTQTPLYILHGTMRWNPMGIMIELAKIASIIVFYALKIYRNYMVKKLCLLKKQAAAALAELNNQNNTDASPADLTNSSALTEHNLEVLWTKILRCQLAVMDKSTHNNLQSIQQSLQPLVDDINLIETIALLPQAKVTQNHI